jgi:hypothetical protein
VNSFESLQKRAKEMSSLPASEWEAKILEPMRIFHQSWLDLAGQLSLPQEPPIRKEAEKASVRSLQEQVGNLTLTQLRDWVGMLYPLLQNDENRTLLDKLLRDTENDIRTRFQQDLHEFISRCQKLSTSCSELKPKEHKKAEEIWQQFAGTVRSLEHSAEKFPKTELSFDEKTKKILEEEAPEQLKNALEKWLGALSSNKFLKKQQCEKILSTMERIRNIFHRPEAFHGVTEYLENVLLKEEARRRLMKRAAMAASVVLLFLALFLGVRYRIGQQVIKTEAFAKENFDKHGEIADRWESLLVYPAWLFPSSESYQTASHNLILHRQLTVLCALYEKISTRALKGEEIALAHKKLMSLIASRPVPEILQRTQQVLLELRALELLYRMEKADPKTIAGEIQELTTLEQEIKQKMPSFKSYLLEEVHVAYKKK